MAWGRGWKRGGSRYDERTTGAPTYTHRSIDKVHGHAGEETEVSLLLEQTLADDCHGATPAALPIADPVHGPRAHLPLHELDAGQAAGQGAGQGAERGRQKLRALKQGAHGVGRVRVGG